MAFRNGVPVVMAKIGAWTGIGFGLLMWAVIGVSVWREASGHLLPGRVPMQGRGIWLLVTLGAIAVFFVVITRIQWRRWTGRR